MPIFPTCDFDRNASCAFTHVVQRIGIGYDRLDLVGFDVADQIGEDVRRLVGGAEEGQVAKIQCAQVHFDDRPSDCA